MPPVAGSGEADALAVSEAVRLALVLDEAVALVEGLALGLAEGLADGLVLVIPSSLGSSSHAMLSSSASRIYGSPGNKNSCASSCVSKSEQLHELGSCARTAE